jgi:hypothetical protein
MNSSRFLKFATIPIFAFVVFLGCSKTSTNTNNPPPVTPLVDTPILSNDPVVYAAGKIYQNQVSCAAYWKNNQLVKLSDSLSEGEHITVLDTNVFVCGIGGFGRRACYWKNGVFTSLYHGISSEYTVGICSSGQDIYIGGTGVSATKDVAEYWKNGQAVIMKPDSDVEVATGIAVSGSDVYLTGYAYNQLNKSQAVLWKNGTLIRLTDGNHYALASGIFIQGNDVYVSGYETDQNDSFEIAKYWKNGVATNISDGTSSCFAHSIFVSGNDVYAAGFQHAGTLNSPTGPNIATYWKNGVATKLFDGTSNTDAYSILVFNSDLYSAYNNSTASAVTPVPSYLKNKVPQQINAGSSVYGIVYDLCVKLKN